MEKEKEPQNRGEKQTRYQPELHIQDVNNREIFKNHRLTAQFLNHYMEIPIFHDIREEDIEDVTKKYQAFLGVTFEADTVKKVLVREADGIVRREVYVISLIEHKSKVDYDVAMQLLRYMSVIWYEYGAVQNRLKKDSNSLRSFRYPLIIPIVYYEGKEKWTAGLHLRERIDYVAGTESYIPDFRYVITGPSQYTNDELSKKGDEMSLIMMMNKIQTEEDLKDFRNVSEELVNQIYQNATADIQETYRKILWSLLMKMKMPNEEAEDIVKHVQGDRSMGYLFENMDEIDIQAERRKTQKQRELTEEAKRETEEAKKETEEAKKETEEAKKETEEAKKETEEAKKETEEERKRADNLEAQLEEYKKKYGELR